MRSKYKWIFTLLLALSVQFSFAQEKTVTGTVSDASGTLPSANVQVQGTKTSTQTDLDGKYAIKAKVGDVLVFSYVGMSDSTMKVGAANVYNVKLSEGTLMKEVQITGALGIKRNKNAVASSYQTVSSQELKSAANPDAVRSLAGKVSGITVNATGSGINGGNSIRVRSMLSLTGSTEALVVIDNVISTADVLASIPSDAIENLTVLKGAQGAALYGSQGKQGVVVVSTKKGSKNGKMSVNFSSTADFEEINFVPQRQITYGQGWYGGKDRFENGAWGPKFDGLIEQVGITANDGSFVTAPYSSRGNDGLKEFYQMGTIFQNNLNLNVGGEDGYVNLNIGNLRRDFILEGDVLNRNTIVLNLGKTFNKFKIGGNFNFTNQKTKQANVTAQTTRSDYTILTTLLQTATNIPVKDFKDRGLAGWNGYYQNPWWAKDNNRLDETNNFFNFGLNSSYEFNKHVNVSYNGALQFRNVNQISFANKGVSPDDVVINNFTDVASSSEYFQSNFGNTNYYGDFLLNLNYDLTDNVGMKLNLGQNFQYDYRERISQGGTNLQVPFLYNISNVINPAIPSTLTNNRFTTKSTATFANLDLNYKDYLFLNATARYEGNSVAKKGNQFYFYPSVGVSFIPTKAIESLKDKNTLSSMKVYGNFTRIGSLDPVNAYEILELSSIATNFPFPIPGNSYNDLTSFTDPNIRPEIYTTYEAGINLGFLKDRLTLDVAAYLTNTTDLINDSSLSAATGLFSKKQNSGELEGKGYEIDLGFMPIKTENFKWNGRLSFSAYDTKVLDLSGTNRISIFDGGNSAIDGEISGVVGYSFPYITGTDWVRDNAGNVIVNATTGAPSIASGFKNLGRVTPDYIVGFTNNFEYKGIGLSVTADYRTGHSFLSQTKYNLTWNGHLVESGDVSRENGWILPGSVIPDVANPGQFIPNTTVLTGGNYVLPSPGNPNKTQDYYTQASGLGSFNIIDATALKIREIALSYSLPSKLISKTGLSSFKFSINARNPFVFLADGGFIKAKNGGENRGYADPETSSQFNRSSSNASRNAAGTLTNTSRNGIGFIGDGQYPSTRTFGFSINATF